MRVLTREMAESLEMALRKSLGFTGFRTVTTLRKSAPKEWGQGVEGLRGWGLGVERWRGSRGYSA